MQDGDVLEERDAILHLCCMTSTKYGGVEHYVAETIRRCNELGYRSVVQYEELPLSDAYRGDLGTLGAEVVALDTSAGLLRCTWRLWQLIRRTRPRIVHTYFPRTPVLFAVALAAKAFRVPRRIAMVLSMHHLPRRAVKARAYNLYDRVICISEAIAENLRYAGVKPELIFTLYTGVFAHVRPSLELRRRFRQEFGISDGETVFACTAFDTYFKGLDVLLESFERLARGGKSVRLLIIGVDPGQSRLPAMARELGIADRVSWPGIRDEGWQIVNAADIYVQSSRCEEGLSMATIEAMVLGLPVVATRVAGPAEIVVDGVTGYLCEPDDVDALARAMARMLDETDRWQEMGEAGQKRYREGLRAEESVRTLVERHYLG